MTFIDLYSLITNLRKFLSRKNIYEKCKFEYFIQ